MIESRKAGKDEALGDVKSAKSANSEEAFSKLQQMFILLVTGQWGKHSEKFHIYITHLVALNIENQCVFLDAIKKQMMAIGRLHITFRFNVIPHLAISELLRANTLNGNTRVKRFLDPTHTNLIFKSQ
jgi:hypothetical protein